MALQVALAARHRHAGCPAWRLYKDKIMHNNSLHDINNQTLWEIDWAKTERQSFLAKLQRCPARRRFPLLLIAGIPASQVWNADVSGNDRRSVKAYLAGRGDWRVAWWELNERLHFLLHPRHALEHAMVAFHKRHHALTLFVLQGKSDVREVTAVILRRGVLAGIRHGMRLAFLPDDERIALMGEVR